MTSIIKLIFRLLIVMLAISASFRAMNAMMVHDNAKVYFDSGACPVKPSADGECYMVGSVSRSFLNEEVEISQGSAVTLVPDQNVRVISYSGDSVRYEPFGKVIAFLTGVSILGTGLLLAFGPPFPIRRSSPSLA